jgi:hypothetical protein
MDVEDRTRVSASDVWGEFSDPILAASGRYGTSFVAIGRLYRDATGSWVGRWSLYGDLKNVSWQTSAQQVDDVLTQGIRELSTRMAREYAGLPVVVAGSEGFTLRVEGIQDMAGYARVDSYLKRVSGVRNVQLVVVEPNAVVFRLRLEFEPPRIIHSLASEGVLAPVETLNPSAGTGRVQEATFRLLP